MGLTRATFDTWVRPTTAQRVDGHREITCVNARAQDWLEHRLGNMIRRTRAEVGEIKFRAR